MNAGRERIQALIELSHTAEEADKIIEENYGFSTIGEKIAFLKGMFDIQIMCEHNSEGMTKEEIDETCYWVMLNNVLHYSNYNE